MLWRRIDLQSLPSDFVDAPLIACYRAKVFHYWMGRNAYRTTWVTTSAMETPVSPDKDALLQRIDCSRMQGSVFWLTEVPALVLASESTSLVVFEVDSSAPFQTGTKLDSSHLSVAKLATSIVESNSSRLVFESNPPLPRSSRVFETLKSWSDGGAYALRWKPDPKISYRLEFLDKVQRRISARLRREA